MITADPIFYCSLFLILSTLIPLIRHDFWIFRVFEYPRLQKLFLNAVLLVILLIWHFPEDLSSKIILAVLLINFLYLLYLIFPFTPIAPKQIIKSRHPSGDTNITLLIANVYQENRKYQDYHEVIKKCNPDLILMVETNQWWQDKMDSIGNIYPHQIKVPLENTYGMLLYSRLELIEGAVKFLVEEDIPSIEVNVKLKTGQEIKLYCLHPQPPVPQENPRSTERDKEILVIAKKAKACEIPVLVVGDLNDVAWSYSTKLFSKISGLLDPRL